MDALDMLFLLAGLMAAAAISAGCLVGFIVWAAGGRNARLSEVCPPADKP